MQVKVLQIHVISVYVCIVHFNFLVVVVLIENKPVVFQMLEIRVIQLLRNQLNFALDLGERLRHVGTILACSSLFPISVLVIQVFIMLVVGEITVIVFVRDINQILFGILRRSEVHRG